MQNKSIAKAREIKNAEISFISLVNRAANKRKFLIMKGTDIMNKKQLTPEELQEFIAQSILQSVVQILEACGMTEQAQIAKQADADGKHYLHDLII